LGVKQYLTFNFFVMAIKIDQEACIGCGACAAVCPAVFQLNEAGKAEVIKEDELECAKNGAESCPVQAIKID
jgi:ferredoxin